MSVDQSVFNPQDLQSPEEMEKMLDHAREASDFLKALAHEGRLIILCLLVEGEKSVSELEAVVGMGQPIVSQQLMRLRADHLVKTRRAGKSIYYSLASEEARQIVTLLYRLFCEEGAGAAQNTADAP